MGKDPKAVGHVDECIRETATTAIGLLPDPFKDRPEVGPTTALERVVRSPSSPLPARDLVRGKLFHFLDGSIALEDTESALPIRPEVIQLGEDSREVVVFIEPEVSIAATSQSGPGAPIDGK